jgi:hypothetical protein
MSVGAVIIVGIIRIVGFVYTWLTIPIYWIVQQPWKVKKLSNELKVRNLKSEESQRNFSKIFKMIKAKNEENFPKKLQLCCNAAKIDFEYNGQIFVI